MRKSLTILNNKSGHIYIDINSMIIYDKQFLRAIKSGNVIDYVRLGSIYKNTIENILNNTIQEDNNTLNIIFIAPFLCTYKDIDVKLYSEIIARSIVNFTTTKDVAIYLTSTHTNNYEDKIKIDICLTYIHKGLSNLLK